MSENQDQSRLPVEARKIEPASQPENKIPPKEIFIRSMEYEHWLVAGKSKGAGKTTLAIALIFWLKNHVEMFRDALIVSSIPIYEKDDVTRFGKGYDPLKPNNFPKDNYCGSVLHPDFRLLDDYRDALYLKELYPGRVCILLLDDIGLLARARDWNTSRNKFFTILAKNARHNGTFIIYTCQRANEADIDLRFNVDRIFIPKFREEANEFDENYSERMEAMRGKEIDWDEYKPVSATERFVLPWEEDRTKRKTLIINTQNPLATGFGLRPTWKEVQTLFDTRKEPTYSLDSRISQKYLKKWGDSLYEELVKRGDSLIKRLYISRRVRDLRKIPSKIIEEDVDAWRIRNNVPLTDEDRHLLIYNFKLRFDEQRKAVGYVMCKECRTEINVTRSDVSYVKCDNPECRMYAVTQRVATQPVLYRAEDEGDE